MNFNLFLEEINKLSITLNEEQQIQIKEYIDELIEYNSHTNLTAIRNYEDILLKHFYDSITLVKAYDFTKEVNVLDIGSGAGFPGLVLKIVFPNIKLTLLDSNNKKTKFLNQIVNNLKLTNIEIINDRAENFIKDNREKFDVVTSRAVAHLRIISELSIPYLKIGGKFLVMKTNSDEELQESISTINYLNSEIEKILEIELPIEHSKRNIIIIKKNKSNGNNVPRNYSQIVKKSII
ncbi:MAG: 16S rRNA (guanine(527)-N(7))-methyltransferase RsmG [Bacilli bacterium]|nr:16S rRNA (guanine(527)-N(7))-methyltransferase RsmG [Bacilli bacterium]